VISLDQVTSLYIGTISGTEPSEYGSLIELTNNGKDKIKLPSGEERTFLEDYDTVIMRGFAEKDGVRVGFGECVSGILPAIARNN
jgi:fumarylacetoacetase